VTTTEVADEAERSTPAVPARPHLALAATVSGGGLHACPFCGAAPGNVYPAEPPETDDAVECGNPQCAAEFMVARNAPEEG
jgi:hypothetical protein